VLEMEELREQLTKALDHFPYIIFDKKHPWHRSMVYLYCTVVEYSDALFNQFKVEKSVAIPLIIRSLLEAYVDLKNLCENPEYGYNLQVANVSEWLRVAKEAETLENPYLEGFAAHESFEEQVSDWEKEIADLKERGFSKLNRFESFKLAGREDEYKSLYNFLCSFAHNNERALIDRHTEISKDNSDFKMVMFKEFKAEKEEHYLGLASQILLESSLMVHAKLETGYKAAFDGT
jgi:hypothetical protein